ncbi:MAG: permease [Actinobacteria bacterium]|nr:permease [Actinomycetota bacterium]
MSSHQAPSAPPDVVDDEGPRDLVSRAITWLIGLVAVVVLVVVASAFLPRWWAQRIGDQVNGSMVGGIGLGLFYGFVFVALPLLVLRLAFRRGRSWRFRLWMLAIALLLATPNLLTLSIVVGSGNAAHAGDRILDVEGPGFRYATVGGALAAAALFLWIEHLVRSRRRTRQRADRLDAELKQRREVTPSPEPPSPSTGS